MKYGGAVIGIEDKPPLQFPFDTLHCDGTASKTLGGANTALTPDEKASVLKYLGDMDGHTYVVNGISSDGRYRCNVTADQVVLIANSGPPPDGNYVWDFNISDWVKVHGVAADGTYLGSVPDGQYSMRVPGPPPASPAGEVWRWRDVGWIDARSPEDQLMAAKRAARSKVTVEAVQASLGLVTPGMDPIYREKLAEAREILFSGETATAADGMDEATLRSVYPLTWASIPADGATPSIVAQKVTERALATTDRAAVIEKKRRAAVVAIENAADISVAMQAANVNWKAD
jgi:hypothetical protein